MYARPGITSARRTTYCFNHARRSCPICDERAFKPTLEPTARKPYIRKGSLPNDQLREFVIRAMRWDPTLTFMEIAERAGLYRPGGIGDASRVTRVLGMTHYIGGQRQGRRTVCVAQTVSEETAVAIARAIHIDPWEIGL